MCNLLFFFSLNVHQAKKSARRLRQKIVHDSHAFIFVQLLISSAVFPEIAVCRNVLQRTV